MKVDVDQIKNKALPILKEAGVVRSALFGSCVRGENRENSDIDILVGLPQEKSLLDFVDLKIRLGEALGRNVDLVEYATIKPLLRDTIMSEQIRIL